MLLKELVEVNQKGNVANAVNFDMMDDPEMNQELCDSFIFNYDSKKPELSTVGILDRLKESFHSRNEPNIHMMIQQYGKGKSHFAVVLANFFGKPADSEEVRGILDQVDKATSGSDKVIGERLKSYKQRQQRRHLVICLNGIRGGDIRKQFLQVLLKALKAEKIEDSVASHLCSEPLRYLESLSSKDRVKAEAYLESVGNPDGDVNSLIKLLSNNNPGVILRVKEIFRHLTGFSPNFQDDVNVEIILRDLLDKLCSGDHAPFEGILILFDEMNYYLQSWAANQIGAGGNALQSITEICELYKGKIALLSFTQIHPSSAVGISPSVRESYLKISSRLAPKESTYDGPASSLELVIDNMLDQKEETPLWKDFLRRWDDTLLSTARDAFEKRIKTYQQRGWSLDYFYNHLSKGCFPLHPITAYLLCNLAFTQDRTAIQFIKGYVNQFIEQTPVEENERLSYIYPIDLVDTFAENFSNEGIYKRYQEACKVVSGSDNPDELKALKALFLYFASGEKLLKEDREVHEELLGALAGLSIKRTKAALQSLMNTRDLISYKSEIKLYRFWEGISPKGIEEEIEDLIRDKVSHLQNVVASCQSNRKVLLGDTICVANQFVRDRKLVSDDWRYEIKFYSPDSLIRDLSSARSLRSTEERGILAYVLAETQEELQDLRRTVDDHLSHSPNKVSFAVAIPLEETGDLARVLLKRKMLGSIDSQQKRLWGTAACDQLEQRWEEQLITRLRQILQTCSYHSIALNKLPVNQQNQPTCVVSALLKELYPFVPPVESVDRLRSSHPTGKQIVALVASQLIADALSPQTLPKQSFYKSVIDSVFVSSWGLLKKTSNKYLPQEPKEDNLKAAWHEISRLTALEELPEKNIALDRLWTVLSEPPYGYSEYNFTVLLAAWLAYHRREIYLRGPEAVKPNKGSVSVLEQPLKEWANTDLFQDPKAFVRSWIVKDKAKLLRKEGLSLPELPCSPMNQIQAQDYLAEANSFLESAEAEPQELVSIRRTIEKIEVALEPLNSWFQPVELTEVLADDVATEMLLELHSQLRQPLPSYSPEAGFISVRPTTEQRTRHDAASQTIASRIEQHTERVSLQSENLESIEACNTYKAEVQSAISTFEQTPELPDHLQDILQNALRVAEKVRRTLEEDARIKQLLEAVQTTARALNDYSSQADFTRALGEIDAARQQIPAGRAEADEVQLQLQDIDRQYQELNQKLDAWEEKLVSATTQRQVVALLEETAKDCDRFTDLESQERISNLRERLNRELAGIESKSQTETLLKAELDNARQHLQRLRDLPDSKIGEAFQAYQELKDFQFTSIEDVSLLQRYQERLESFKAQGYDQMTKRFQQICDRRLLRLEFYENRKEFLNRSLSALDNADEFETVKSHLTQSLAELEVQADILRQQVVNDKKQTADRQTFKEAQQLRPNQNISISACEEALACIEMLQAKLHTPEQFQAEINQIRQACQEKIRSHVQNLSALREQLSTVNTSDVFNQLQLSHVRLEAAFLDSSEFDAYQEIGAVIDDIKGDLKTLDELENRCRLASSIATCREILEELAKAQVLLKYPERFRESRLNQLESIVQQKIQNYQQDLAQIEQKLTYASTLAEIHELQQTLLKQSSHYANSNESDRVDALSEEITNLVRLMPLMDMAKAANLDACKHQIEQLNSWLNSSIDVSQGIQDRISTALEELEKRRQKLLTEKRESARSWLGALSGKTSQMLSALRQNHKYDLASEILMSLRNGRNDHANFLNTAERKVLLELERQCLGEQSKHTGNQIITLFRQLPRLQRQALHKHLERYLVDQTEEDLLGKSEEGWWQRLFRSDNQKTNQND